MTTTNSTKVLIELLSRKFLRALINKVGLFFVISILYIACSPKTISNTNEEAPCIDQTRINNSANCPYIWKPVCGCDRKTYANECEAVKSGLTKWSSGACEEVM
jgi:hypothetical protein